MDTGGAELFEQWRGKQEAMGRTIPETIAPYYAHDSEVQEDIDRVDELRTR